MMHKPQHKQPTKQPQTLKEALLQDKQEKARADAWFEFQMNKIAYQKSQRKDKK